MKAALPYRLRQGVKTWPGVLALQLGVLRRRSARQLVTARSTMCLEGFPRSGNGFAYTCVRDVLGVPAPAIGHHTHSIANVRRAVRRGLPTYVLVREPLDACTSLVIWGASASAEDALQAYAAYHRALTAMLDGVTILPFEQLVADPGGVLARIARDLELAPPNWNEAVAVSVERTIARSDDERRVERFVRTSLPDADKDARKQRLAAAALASPTLAECRRLRDHILARAPDVVGRDTPEGAR